MMQQTRLFGFSFTSLIKRVRMFSRFFQKSHFMHVYLRVGGED